MTMPSSTSSSNVITRASRAAEVLAVLRRHGFGPLSASMDSPPGPRLKDALIELGAPAVKLGQFLAQRPDLVGPEIALALESLHADVPPEPYTAVFSAFETSLGVHPEDYFETIDREPIAAGSIGQVHMAVLRDGRPVAVKIRRSDIVTRCAEDLDVLRDVAKLTEFSGMLPQFDIVEAIERFRSVLGRELDLRIEAAALHNFGQTFDGDERVDLPQVIDEASSDCVLTMTRVDGIPFTDPARIRAVSGSARRLVENGVTVFLDMIVDGVYHADPHPGNLFLSPSGQIGIVDFGAVGWLHPSRRQALLSGVRAFKHNDSIAMTATLLQITRGPPPDQQRLTNHVRTLMQRHRTVDMHNIDVEELLNDIIELLIQHERQLSGDMATLFRCVIALDGTARAIEPEYDLTAAIDRWSKGRKEELMGTFGGPLLDALPDWVKGSWDLNLFQGFPRTAQRTLEHLNRGTLTMQVRPVGLDGAVHHLTTATMVASLVVAGAVLLATRVPPVVFDLSILGLLALLLGIGIGITNFASMFWHHLRR